MTSIKLCCFPSYLPACILFILAVCIECTHFANLCFGDDTSAVSRLVEATQASRANRYSEKADAVFRHWNRDGLLNRHSLISMEHVGDQYRMDIRHQDVEHRGGFFYDRVILVSDGKSLFANLFSDRIRPAGCEIRVVEKNFSAFMISSGGLGLDPASPSEVMLGDLSVIRNKGQSVGETDSGNALIRYNLTENFEVIVEASPDVGFNAVRCEGRNTRDPGTSTTYTAEWDKRDGIWFIRKLVQVMRVKGEETSLGELEFTSVELNVSVPPERFTLDALEPCEKTRLIDDRPDAEVKVLRYDPDVSEKELDTIAEQAAALPARVPPPRDPLRPGPVKTGSMLLWLVLFNVAVLAVLAAIFGYRRLKTRRLGR